MEIRPEFYEQRRVRLPWMNPAPRLDPEEAERRILDGKGERILVKPPDSEVPLPCRTAEDLQELKGLPDNDLGNQLKSLAQQGWVFASPAGVVGLYGAYNALTDQPQPELTARKRGTDVPLNGNSLQEIHRFEQSSPLAQLERQGYTFNGNAAYGAEWVGKNDEKWLRPDQATPENLERFERLRELAASADQARRAYEMPKADSRQALLELDRNWRLALEVSDPGQPHLAFGRTWEAGLDERARGTMWSVVLAGTERYPLFQAVLEKLEDPKAREQVLRNELATPGADAQLVGSYARKAGADILPALDEMGLPLAREWCAVVSSERARQAIQKTFLENPRPLDPVPSLSQLWQENRYSSELGNDERARLVRHELGKASKPEEIATLADWLRQVDPRGSSAELRAAAPKVSPAIGRLSQEWCALLPESAHGEVIGHLLRQSPGDTTTATRTEILADLWQKLDGVDSTQRAKLVRHTLEQRDSTWQDVAPRLGSWLAELEGTRNLPAALAGHPIAPELDLWIEALATDAGKKLGARIFLQHHDEPRVEQLQAFWRAAGSQIENPERAGLVKAHLAAETDVEVQWTLGRWLVQLEGCAAVSSLERFLPPMLKRYVQEWGSHKAVLTTLLEARPADDRPQTRVDLLAKIWESDLPAPERAKLVEANLRALSGRPSEEGWDEAVLKLSSWKLELTGNLADLGPLESHPVARELEGWLGALTSDAGRKAAGRAVLGNPTATRLERMKEFWQLAHGVENDERARLVEWSLSTLPPDDPDVLVHANWLHQLRGEAAGEQVCRLLQAFPERRQNAEQVLAWRQAVATDATRKKLTELLLGAEEPKTALELLAQLWQENRYVSGLPNEERARLVRHTLTQPLTAADTAIAASWMYQLEKDQGLDAIRAALQKHPELKARAERLDSWLSVATEPDLRQEIASAVLPEDKPADELLPAILRGASAATPEQKAALVRHVLDELPAGDQAALARTAAELAQLVPPSAVEPLLDKLQLPAAKLARAWGEAVGSESGKRHAYAVWLRHPECSGTPRERIERLSDFWESCRHERGVDNDSRAMLVRWELSQLERMPDDAERAAAVGQVGRWLLELSGPDSLPVVFKLLHLDQARELLDLTADPKAREAIGQVALGSPLTGVELGTAVLDRYVSLHVGNDERYRLTEWCVDQALPENVPLRECLESGEKLLAHLGEGLLQRAGSRFFEGAAKRYSRAATIQVDLAAHAQRVAAAPDVEIARRLVDDGLETLKVVVEVEDMLGGPNQSGIEEREEAVLVGGVRVPKREGE